MSDQPLALLDQSVKLGKLKWRIHYEQPEADRDLGDSARSASSPADNLQTAVMSDEPGVHRKT